MKAEQLDELFDKGEDISAHLDLSTLRRPNLQQKQVNVDLRTYRPADRFLYPLLILYPLAYVGWFFWPGTGSSRVGEFMIFGLPIVALLILVSVQFSDKRARFSALANFLALAVIGGTAFLTLMIIGAATASV